eukprot:3876251-Rhodomonas_salina.1
MWNPKTSRTWSFGSYQGWTPPPNFYRQPNSAPAEAGPMGAYSGEAKGTTQPDLRAMSPFAGVRDQNETPPTLRYTSPAGYRDSFAGASPRQIFPPSSNFGANPSPRRPAAAGRLPFVPDGAQAPDYSCFPRPQNPEHQHGFVGFPPPPRVEITDENTTPQRPIGTSSASDLQTSMWCSAGDSFLAKDASGGAADNVFSFREIMGNADLRPIPPKNQQGFAQGMRNIWSVGSNVSPDSGAAADVMKVALGEKTPQYGSIGELVLAESASGSRFEASRDSRAKAEAGVALYFGGGDSGLFPLSSDPPSFAAECEGDSFYPDAPGADRY